MAQNTKKEKDTQIASFWVFGHTSHYFGTLVRDITCVRFSTKSVKEFRSPDGRKLTSSLFMANSLYKIQQLVATITRAVKKMNFLVTKLTTDKTLKNFQVAPLQHSILRISLLLAIQNSANICQYKCSKVTLNIKSS